MNRHIFLFVFLLSFILKAQTNESNTSEGSDLVLFQGEESFPAETKAPINETTTPFNEALTRPSESTTPLVESTRPPTENFKSNQDTSDSSPRISDQSPKAQSKKSKIQSSFVYQILMPEKNHHEVTPFVKVHTTTATDINDSNIAYNQTLAISGLSYNYGFTDQQAFGFDIQYLGSFLKVGTETLSRTQKNNGFMNSIIHYKGLFNLNHGSVFTELGYSFQSEKETLIGPDNDGNYKGNAAQAQNQILLTLGTYGPLSDDTILGASLNYSKAQEGEKKIRTTGSSDVNIKVSAGDQMTATVFFQFINQYRPNLSIGFQKVYSSELTSPSGVKSYSPRIEYLMASANGQFQTGTTTYFIPEMTYVSALKNDYYEKYSTFIFAGKLRFLF